MHFYSAGIRVRIREGKVEILCARYLHFGEKGDYWRVVFPGGPNLSATKKLEDAFLRVFSRKTGSVPVSYDLAWVDRCDFESSSPSDFPKYFWLVTKCFEDSITERDDSGNMRPELVWIEASELLEQIFATHKDPFLAAIKRLAKQKEFTAILLASCPDVFKAV